MRREKVIVMIVSWIAIIVGVIAVVGGIVSLATSGNRDSYDQGAYKWGGLAAIIVGILLAAGCAFWLYGTAAGERAQKSFHSSTGGGLTRVVTVYDMQGDKIATYEGKFDVDANEKRIIFDIPQPDGSSKRVQIWSSTGTVTIEEK
jgi:hypothetical protein